MPKGRKWAPEGSDITDPVSGVRVRQLTDYRAHSHHLYFTNPGWHDGGRRMLLGSERENAANLYSIELSTGELTQLTDLAPLPAPCEVDFLGTTVNPAREEAYFWYGRKIMAVDLTTLATRELFERPQGFRRSMINCTADGKYVIAGFFEDLSDRINIDYMHGYVGFPETHDAYPESRIVKVATDGSGAEEVWSEKYWIGHVNTSPTQADLITFCHEGPWAKVDNRIWGMKLSEGKPWKIRPCTEEGERVGHEYWHGDGENIGFHGSYPDGRGFLGKIRYDNTGHEEAAFSKETGHIHSNDMSLIVGDGGGVIRTWKWNGEAFEGPRLLCEHRSSMHVQIVHAHPRFTTDGKHVVFTSDRRGYGNVFMADYPDDFDSLPEIDDKG